MTGSLIKGTHVEDLCRYAGRPFAFIARYVRSRPIAHTAVLIAVFAAVGCSIGTQYGVKLLVDTLSQGRAGPGSPWGPFAILAGLIAADNLFWRLAGFIGSGTFVRVTGSLRHDLFRHVTGHPPGYFINRAPGTLTSRISAASNALFTIENMLAWNVIPPLAATIGAVMLVTTVSGTIATVLLAAGGVLVVVMYRIAGAGRQLRHKFADRAAAVDGEMVDVVGNMALITSFDGLRREHRRFDAAVHREMAARWRSLLHLERLRLLHAVTTIVLTFGLLAWAIELWQQGTASTGDVVLICTLGISVLHATRDLAVALVDVTQHIARMSEALSTLLVPHELQDHPDAVPLETDGANVAFEHVSFAYPGGPNVLDDFNLSVRAGERVGLIGRSGGGKSTLICLLQRFYDVGAGRILIDGQDISRVTQRSLRKVIGVVPQDIALFHRTLRENIRYGRPAASDAEVNAAAAAARCDGFIRELPEGFDTVVGERGLKLSGGQRQRIAIARAFLKDAPLLLLDEATSALDAESEEAIRRALQQLMRGRTVIAIAHRLSTVRNFDRVVVLESGRIIQDGPPDELVRCDGIYRELIEREIARLGA